MRPRPAMAMLSFVPDILMTFWGERRSKKMLEVEEDCKSCTQRVTQLYMLQNQRLVMDQTVKARRMKCLCSKFNDGLDSDNAQVLQIPDLRSECEIYLSKSSQVTLLSA